METGELEVELESSLREVQKEDRVQRQTNTCQLVLDGWDEKNSITACRRDESGIVTGAVRGLTRLARRVRVFLA